MNNLFAAKLLQNLRNKKGEKGFTLIELLVVVIIIGVLAAVALPNLLAQVGKARESEAKTAIGALTRAQQAYHLEGRAFYDGTSFTDALGVVPGTQFYTYSNSTATATNATLGGFDADATDSDNDGTRDFASEISYDNASGSYATALCVATVKNGSGVTVEPDTASGGSCTSGSLIK